MRHARGMLLAAFVLMSVPAAAQLASAKPAQKHISAEGVARAWMVDLNAGMETGDFRALGQLYADDATFTVSTPAGVTTVYRGRDQILGFYRGLAVAERGSTFTQDSLTRLAPDVVLAYEQAGKPGQSKPARCIHVYQVRKGLIRNEHWTVFFGGTP